MIVAPAMSRPSVDDVPQLLRGDTPGLAGWLAHTGGRRWAWYVSVILLGAGFYGASIGWWRSPWQGLYTAIKFPLILLLTASGNALINSFLAPLLGLPLTFRQSLQAVLMSFSIIALILGAFSPLVLFLIWNVPAYGAGLREATLAFTWIKVSQVGLIAFAGIAANVRLRQLLERLGGSRAVARRVLFAWLGINLLLGAQLTWILRPFFGSPHFAVEFLREDALEGNFYEIVFHSVKYLWTQ